MKRVKALFLVGIFVLFVVLVYGCSHQASKGGGGRSYFPNEEGYSWLLRRLQDGRGTLITAEGMVVIPGDITVQLFKSSYLDASGTLISTGEEYMKITDAGVYHYGIPSSIVDPPAVLLDFPLTVGKSWTVSSSGGDVTTANVIVNEEKTVLAGTFECYKVNYITMYGTIEMGSSNTWYGDNAGIVLSISYPSMTRTELEWKSF